MSVYQVGHYWDELLSWSVFGDVSWGSKYPFIALKKSLMQQSYRYNRISMTFISGAYILREDPIQPRLAWTSLCNWVVMNFWFSCPWFPSVETAAMHHRAPLNIDQHFTIEKILQLNCSHMCFLSIWPSIQKFCFGEALRSFLCCELGWGTVTLPTSD